MQVRRIQILRNRLRTPEIELLRLERQLLTLDRQVTLLEEQLLMLDQQVTQLTRLRTKAPSQPMTMVKELRMAISDPGQPAITMPLLVAMRP